jgi:hypothetical protein
MLSLALDETALETLIARVIESTLARLDEARAQMGDREGLTEEEAARLIGLEPHVLRDERKRARIKGYVIVGGRVRYRRQDVIAYLTRQAWTPESARTSGWQRGRARSANGDDK